MLFLNEFFEKKIILFSPIRTGSTYIWNILNKYYYFDIPKQHNLKNININKFYIVTIRNPLDSIISSATRYDITLTSQNVNEYINEYLEEGGKDILDLNLKLDNVLLLKYEDFVNSEEYLAKNLINFLNISFKRRLRSIIKKFNIENVINISKKFDSFNEYDTKTHIHGNHISDTRGSSVYKYLDKEVLDLIIGDEIVAKIIKKFNYKLN